MKYRKGVGMGVAFIVVAALGYYYFGSASKKPAGVVIPAYLEESVAQAWKEFQPENGSFKVLFPSSVTHAMTTKSSDQSNEVTRYDNYSARGSDRATYTLNTVQYPASFDTKDPSALFQSLLHNMVTSVSETEIIGQNPTTFLNYPALDFNLQNPNYATVGRVILAGKTLYVLTVTDPDLNGLEKRFHTFADSLTLG